MELQCEVAKILIPGACWLSKYSGDEESMKDRPVVARESRKMWWIDVILFLSGIVSALSGIYFLAFPAGYQGGRNPWYNVAIIFDRHTWADIHLWSGVIMIAAAIIHLVVHWKWVTRTARKIGKELSSQYQTVNNSTRFNIGINALLGIGFLFVAVSGIYFLFVPGGRWAYDPMLLWGKVTWDLIHTWAGVVMISAALIHFGIHWRWVKNITRKMLASILPGQAEASPAEERSQAGWQGAK